MLISSIISLIVFALVICIILIGFRKSGSKRKFKIDYGSAPLIGVLILLLTSTINFETLFKGIVGSEHIQPYAIIILFMSLAYVCISIDLTGAFEYLALKTVKAAGTSGKRLFIYLYFFSSILTIFTSNDIVILTITPIIIYIAKYTKINPFPYLIGQFFAANIWSITLYIGNPTNIIVAEAFGLGFLQYTEWTLIPTIGAGLVCLLLLLIIFRNDIPVIINAPDVDPKSAIKDKRGAIFGMICLFSCLTLLAIAPMMNVSLWQITLSFALIFLIYNIIQTSLKNRNNIEQPKNELLKSSGKRMPWKIMPFVIGMFILVESLLVTGWVDFLASSLTDVFINPVYSIFSMMFLSSIVCNLMNNQPMTILFTQILLSNSLIVTEAVEFSLIFALIMGSNFGANLTLIGALAGIMWQKIAKDHDITISFKDFAKKGFLIMPCVIIIASLFLSLEMLFWL